MFALAMLHCSRPRSFTSQPLSSLRHLISFRIHDAEPGPDSYGMWDDEKPQALKCTVSSLWTVSEKMCGNTQSAHECYGAVCSTINPTTSSTGTFNVTRLSASQLFHWLVPFKIHGGISCLLLRHTSDDIQCNGLKCDFDK